VEGLAQHRPVVADGGVAGDLEAEGWAATGSGIGSTAAGGGGGGEGACSTTATTGAARVASSDRVLS
jgi:hypothetical protein